eukprot:6032821-Amphidinium_carterae.1
MRQSTNLTTLSKPWSKALQKAQAATVTHSEVNFVESEDLITRKRNMYHQQLATQQALTPVTRPCCPVFAPPPTSPALQSALQHTSQDSFAVIPTLEQTQGDENKDRDRKQGDQSHMQTVFKTRA